MEGAFGMNANEKYYRRVIGSIGAAMLLFLGLINSFFVVLAFLDEIFAWFPMSYVSYTVTYQLLYSAGYLASFMVPVALLKKLIGGAGYPVQPMLVLKKPTAWWFLIIPAGIAVVYSMAYINASMVSIFDYAEYSSEVLWGNTGTAPAAFELILEFIVICLVPGFCEEFLFRGAILSNLRPFGRSNAILISAFLFSMMHQNAEQLLYTFAAGIVLGLVYEMTGSIWCSTVLHVINNFVSVSQTALFYKLDPVRAALAISILEMGLLVVGVICLTVLVAHFFSKKTDLRQGFFQKELPMSDGYAACPVEGMRAKKLFFTPCMIVFLILAALNVIILLGSSMFYGA